MTALETLFQTIGAQSIVYMLRSLLIQESSDECDA